jgi:hypothetical protein
MDVLLQYTSVRGERLILRMIKGLYHKPEVCARGRQRNASLRPVWVMEGVPGQPELHSVILFQKKKARAGDVAQWECLSSMYKALGLIPATLLPQGLRVFSSVVGDCSSVVKHFESTS